jgi:hypothetical protein
MGSLFDDMMEKHALAMQGSARCEACGNVFFGVDGCPDCRCGNEAAIIEAAGRLEKQRREIEKLRNGLGEQ